MKKIDIACIIDDDPIFIFGAKKILELGDFCKSFLIYNDGLEALENLTTIITSGEKIPEVILLDIEMPIMDGWQFLDRFTKVVPPRKVTIFMVSSSIDPADHERAKKYEDISNFIVKPISGKDLEILMKGVD